MRSGLVLTVLCLTACGGVAASPQPQTQLQAEPEAEPQARTQPREPPSSAALIELVREAEFRARGCNVMEGDAPPTATLSHRYAVEVGLLDQPVREDGVCYAPDQGPMGPSEGAVWGCRVSATPADEDGNAVDDAASFSVYFELDAQGAIIESSPLCLSAG